MVLEVILLQVGHLGDMISLFAINGFFAVGSRSKCCHNISRIVTSFRICMDVQYVFDVARYQIALWLLYCMWHRTVNNLSISMAYHTKDFVVQGHLYSL